MTTIKAIETHYNGYRFRSRLEARWAVFLDELRLEYGYESEGFELPGGERYLPDFWVPYWGAWVEIKRLPEDATDYRTSELWGWIRKASLLSAAADTPVVLVSGSPGVGDYSAVLLRGEDLHGHGDFAACLRCGAVCVVGRVFEGADEDACLLGPRAQPGVRCGHEGPWPLGDTHVDLALKAARRARFEFGERGR